MKVLKFIKPSTGEIIVAQNKEHASFMRSCGWRVFKEKNFVFAKGLEEGKTFYA